MIDKKPKLLPGIDKYLETVDNNASVSAKDLDEVVLRVRSKTGLDISVCKNIVSLFFQEMRNIIIAGDEAVLKEFGRLKVKGPFNSKNKYRVFVKFSPAPKLIKMINGRLPK